MFSGHVGLLSGMECGEINRGKSAVSGAGEVGGKRGVKRVYWRRVCGEYFRAWLIWHV
ncbi:hypothetical protein [Bartonella grahamii]|nr:hypothetical protein [Bartonella grahamii]